MTTELPLMNEFLIQYRHSRVRLFRRNVFKRLTENNGRKSMLTAGIKGQADVYGYYRGTDPYKYAIPFELEFKGAYTIVLPEQKQWRAWCKDWDIPHWVLRAGQTETDSETISRWSIELTSFINDL